MREKHKQYHVFPTLATELLMSDEMNQYSSVIGEPRFGQLPMKEKSNKKEWYEFAIRCLEHALGVPSETGKSAASGLESGDRVVFMRAPGTGAWLRLGEDDGGEIKEIPPKLEFLVLLSGVSQS
eukprot:GHVU01000825.1.p1 GENE.GHVU01000825.1~~GHVU01000825.1.p1  ORF type:complete len:124 (-),score=13.84 GHVU01000825.1:1311-1682(-)